MGRRRDKFDRPSFARPAWFCEFFLMTGTTASTVLMNETWLVDSFLTQELSGPGQSPQEHTLEIKYNVKLHKFMKFLHWVINNWFDLIWFALHSCMHEALYTLCFPSVCGKNPQVRCRIGNAKRTKWSNFNVKLMMVLISRFKSCSCKFVFVHSNGFIWLYQVI